MPATLRMRHAAALPLLLAALVIGSLFAFVPPADAALSRAQRVSSAFDIVRAQKGDPYRYGAAGPNAFDCSGLIYYSYRKAGFSNVPRTSSQQSKAFRAVKRSNMRKGDLVFFHSGGDVYHAAVYAGRKDGRRMVIHASRSGTPVKRDPIWTNSWFARTLR
jgi:cell wall-associated NlpC family hydrolase